MGGIPEHCEETRLRIRLAVYAWAYEVHNDPLVSDAVFDHACRRVKLDASTSDPKMDAWFRENFDPSTGMWVLRHPDKDGLERIYRLIKGSPFERLLRRMVDRQKAHTTYSG